MERSVDKKFKQLFSKILSEGQYDENPRPVWESDKSPAHSLFITQEVLKYDTEHGEVPITSLRPIYFKKAIEELLWIYQDQSSNLELLEERGVHWWENWKLEDGTIGQRYGATVRRYDLVNKLLKGLKEDPFGRRHIMNMWQEKDLLETGALHPCAYETLWSVRKKSNEYYLDCTLVQRSSDFIVAGFINEMQYHALQLAFSKHLSYKVGNFMHVIQNVHIYDRHIETAKEIIKNIGQQDEPEFSLNVPDGTDFYSIKSSDFILKNYNPCKKAFKFELAV